MDNDDNLYPSAGFQPFTEPTEQKVERAREEGMARAAEPIIEKLIAKFDERIAYRDSIDSIPVDLEKNPELHQKLLTVNKLLKDALIKDKKEFEDLIADL